MIANLITTKSKWEKNLNYFIKLSAQKHNCGCFIKGVSQGMDFEQLVKLGLDVMSAGVNKKKQEKY